MSKTTREVRNLKAVVLAAGIGERLGHDLPKALVELEDGQTILQHQLRGLLRVVSPEDVTVVVGFKKESIVERFPDLNYVTNAEYRKTSTARSLLMALERQRENNVLVVEGDVVCHHEVFERIALSNGNRLATHDIPLGEEEMKFLTGDDGRIVYLSKDLQNGEGEALAVNKFDAAIVEKFIGHLRQCDPRAFFEQGINLCIEDGFRVDPLDVTDLYGFDVDTPEDLAEANRAIRSVG